MLLVKCGEWSAKRRGVNDDGALRLHLSVSDDLKLNISKGSSSKKLTLRAGERERARDGIEYKLTAMNEVMEQQQQKRKQWQQQ